MTTNEITGGSAQAARPMEDPLLKNTTLRAGALRGFTLLETLVVLVLLVFLMLLLGSAFGVVRRADVQTERWNHSLNQADAAQAYLRRALLRAQPARDALPGQPALPVFEGEPARMRFLAPAPDAQNATGPKFHLIDVETIDGRCWLMLRLANIDTTQPGARWGVPWGDAQTLAGPAARVVFAYQGIDSMGRQTGWLARWPWPARLPRQVRIGLAQVGPVAWPTMTVPLLLRSADQDEAR